MRLPAACLVAAVFSAPAFAQDIVSVPMRDGVPLHTRIYKRSDVPRPVILLRTPYGAATAAESRVFNLLRTDADEFNDAGYVYVTQDLRGTGLSDGGETMRFVADQADTRDTLEWVAQQPWSDGNVAMWGVSAPGIVAHLALQSPHPSLKCTATVISAGDIYDSFFPGGAYRQELGSGWLPDNAGAGIEARVVAQEARSAWWDEGTISQAELPPPSVKTLVFAGAFDIFSASGIALHQRLVAHSAPNENHILFLGPWAHDSVTPTRNGDFAGAYSGDLKFELQAFIAPGLAIDPRAQFFSFLGWCLRGIGRPNARVRAYRLHINDAPDLAGVRVQGGWAQYDEWPPAAARPQRLNLYRDGALGALPSTPGAPLVISSDPADPVPTRGGAVLFASNEDNVRLGPRNEAALLQRDDVLLFETQSATTAVDIVGNARAEIWASSSTTDVDVHVKVYLRTAQSEYFLMTDGARRGRFVGGVDQIRPMQPGVPSRFEVDLGPMSLRLRPRQAIAIAIQASNSTRFSMNPQVAEPLSSDPNPVPADLSLPLNGTNTSFVELPTLGSRLPAAQPPPGIVTDAGTLDAQDAGTPDVGQVLDAGVQPDASGIVDSGAVDAGPVTGPREEGCSCTTKRGARYGQPGWGALVLWAARRRRNRHSACT